MASKREKAPDRRMRKIALVICEGETEVRYINLLKTCLTTEKVCPFAPICISLRSYTFSSRVQALFVK